MSIASQQGWQRHLTQGGGAVSEVMQKVRALQNSYCLGMRMFEKADQKLLWPENDMECLDRNVALFTPQRPLMLPKEDVALFSMSAIPSQSSLSATEPYPLVASGFNLGHLYDLSDTPQNPAKIVRAFKAMDKLTGWDRYNKNLHLNRATGIAELDEIYRPFSHYRGRADRRVSEEAFINTVFADAGLSGRQLRLVGKAIEKEKNPSMIETTELLVAATREHVFSIVVPVGGHNRIERPVGIIAGCLAGMKHAQRHMPLPVVMYYTDRPYRGNFTVVAVDENECRTKASHLVKRLKTDPDYRFHYDGNRETLDPLNEHAKRLIGEDIVPPRTRWGARFFGGGREV